VHGPATVDARPGWVWLPPRHGIESLGAEAEKHR